MTSRIFRIPAAAFFAALLFVSISSCSSQKKEAGEVYIIPKPSGLTKTGGVFTLEKGMAISHNGNEAEKLAGYLQMKLKPATGFNLDLQQAQAAPETGIYIALSGEKNDGDESYKLDVSKKLVKLTAGTPAGLFHGIQTLRQMFPPEVELTSVQERKWEIPARSISDKPLYSYRGMMLDVSRHFFSVEDVKRLIDQISYYKMNVLHLHLSDDQGWRIEIKSWPKLTEVGGSTQVGGGKGGFYTQEEYSDIVKYAAERYVTIVPEIDMPGHTNAALASYPELNCNDKATELYTGTEVGFSSLCTKKEITYKFIDDVVKEIAALTPGPWFHIGGDESHSTKREDYIPFINRVQEIVVKNGKQIIGWDDISIGTLKPNTTAQYWANAENAKNAVSQGAKLIISPAAKAYLDMQYDKNTKLGLHWAAYIEVDSAYNWDPARLVPGITRENILGVEAPLWAETITNMDEIEYMVFPRLPGYAEIGWTEPLQRNWDEYKLRLAEHGARFKAMGIDYYQSAKVPWSSENNKALTSPAR